MRTYQQEQLEGVIAVVRKVPRGVWVALAVTLVLLLVGLGWAAVLAVQWLLGQDPALAGQAAGWLGQATQGVVPGAIQQVEEVVPGLVEPVRQAIPGVAEQLEQWVPGAGAHLEEAAAAMGGGEAAEAKE